MTEKAVYLVTYCSYCIDRGGVDGRIEMYETYEQARKAFNLEIYYSCDENREDLYADKSHDFSDGHFEVDLDPSEPNTHIGKIEEKTFDTIDQEEIDELVKEEGFTG